MNFFNLDFRRIFTLGLLLAIPMVSIHFQMQSGKEPWIFRPFLMISGSTQSIYSSFSHSVRNTADLYLNLIDIKRDNRDLLEKLEKQNIALAQLEEIRRENQRLSNLLDFQTKSKINLLPTRIIGRDVFPEYQSLLVDRGLEQGVQKGMALMNSNGAIGYVQYVEDQRSHVLLLTDRYAVLDVFIQRTRARGVLAGQGQNEYELKYLKRNDDVVPGDVVVTSGLDHVFPKGVPVGKVIKVEKTEYGFEQIVRVEPAARSNSIEEAFIVLDAQNQRAEKTE